MLIAGAQKWQQQTVTPKAGVTAKPKILPTKPSHPLQTQGSRHLKEHVVAKVLCHPHVSQHIPYKHWAVGPQ